MSEPGWTCDWEGCAQDNELPAVGLRYDPVLEAWTAVCHECLALAPEEDRHPNPEVAQFFSVIG